MSRDATLDLGVAVYFHLMHIDAVFPPVLLYLKLNLDVANLNLTSS